MQGPEMSDGMLNVLNKCGWHSSSKQYCYLVLLFGKLILNKFVIFTHYSWYNGTQLPSLKTAKKIVKYYLYIYIYHSSVVTVKNK